MTCHEVESRGIAEEYLLGRLPDEEADAYEQHYFGCARCYASLEALRAVRSALAGTPAAMPAPTPIRRPIRWGWLAVAAAAVLVVALSAILVRGRIAPAPATTAARAPGATPAPPPVEAEPPQETPAARSPKVDRDVALMAQLARVEPPPYAPPRLRGGAARADFEAGMAAYVAGDYAAAVDRLAAAVRTDRNAEDARFYLGAAQLLSGRPAEAVVTLAPLAEREESAYAEEARFLTAKAWLQQGDAAEARRALDRTVALDGDRAAEARDLRRRLDARRR